MTIGRKTIYSEMMLEATLKYVENFDTLTKAIVPSVAGLSLYLKCSRSSIENWRKEHDDFGFVIEMLLASQEELLINKGLANEYNTGIARMMLFNHGWGADPKENRPEEQIIEDIKINRKTVEKINRHLEASC